MSLSSLNINCELDEAKRFVIGQANALSAIELAQLAAEKEAKENPQVFSSDVLHTKTNIKFGPTSKQGW